MRNRYVFSIIVLVVAAVLFLTNFAARAADPAPGSADDPLLTRSYLESYLQNYYSNNYASLEKQVQDLTLRVTELEREVAALRDQIGQQPAPRQLTVILSVNNTTAYVNGQPRNLLQPPLMENGRVFLPFRFIGEVLGAEVGYHKDTQQVEFRLGSTHLVLTIDRRSALVNGRQEELDAAPRLVNGSTLVPVRVVSEYLGAQVDWDPDSRQVTISK